VRSRSSEGGGAESPGEVLDNGVGDDGTSTASRRRRRKLMRRLVATASRSIANQVASFIVQRPASAREFSSSKSELDTDVGLDTDTWPDDAAREIAAATPSARARHAALSESLRK